MKRGAPDHWKMKELARALKIPSQYALPAANGIMERLWHYVSRYHQTGDLSRVPDWAIADACGWSCVKRVDRVGQDSDKARHFVGILVTVGWLDYAGPLPLECRSLDGTCPLSVHDWSEHADDSVKRTLKNKGLQFFFPNASDDRAEKISPAFPLPKPKPEPGPAGAPPSDKTSPPRSARVTNIDPRNGFATIDSALMELRKIYYHFGRPTDDHDWTRAATAMISEQITEEEIMAHVIPYARDRMEEMLRENKSREFFTKPEKLFKSKPRPWVIARGDSGPGPIPKVTPRPEWMNNPKPE